MTGFTIATIASLAVPLVAGFIGWFALWRRNLVIYSIENCHFCGDEISEKGFWVNKDDRRPLIDTLNVSYFNFGLKHIDEAQFVLFNVSDDYIIHPFHHNEIPENKFTVERVKDSRLLITIRDIPAFERFGMSILNTHPARRFAIQGSGKSYRFVKRHTYLKGLLVSFIGVLAVCTAVLSAIQIITK